MQEVVSHPSDVLAAVMTLDVALRQLAERQHGVVAVAQAHGLGASRAELRRRRASADWEAPTPRTLRLAGSTRTYRQRCMIAVLDAGPGACLSRTAAAALWRLPGFPTGPTEVSRVRGTTRRPGSHEVRLLPEHHQTMAHGVPVTTPACTIFDLAGVLHPGRTERAFDNALARGLTTVGAVRAVAAELCTSGRAGSALMRRLLEEREDGYVAPESGLEARFLSIVQAAGLPLPLRQRDLCGEDWIGRVDFLYPDTRLVVEIDSALHHSTLSDEAVDADRDRALHEAGYRVVRIGEQLVWHRPQEVVRRLLAS